MTYVVSSENSQLVKEDAEVIRIWKFDDPVLQQIAEEQGNVERILIPKNAVRKESSYHVMFLATNQVRSFIEQEEIDFIPIDCERLREV